MRSSIACVVSVLLLAFTPVAMPQTSGQEEPKSLAFVVERVDRRPAGEIILTFQDGQVWQQADRNSKLDIQRGEQVVIRRAASGVFTLVTRSGLSTRVVRLH